MISLALNMNGLWLLTRLTGFKSTAGEVSCDLAWLRNTTYYFILMLKHQSSRSWRIVLSPEMKTGQLTDIR